MSTADQPPDITIRPALFHGELWVPAADLTGMLRTIAVQLGEQSNDPAEGAQWRELFERQADEMDLLMISGLSEVQEGQDPTAGG